MSETVDISYLPVKAKTINGIKTAACNYTFNELMGQATI
jgi:hypothetical protein